MSDELVDVIDEQGNVLQAIGKKEAHAKGLLHVCVVSEVIDSQGRWLLVKQASDRQDADQYVSPIGGHIRAGESEEDALKREAEEEIGLTGHFTYEFVGRAILNRFVVGRQENHMFVMYKIFSDAEPILNHESTEYKYFTEEEIGRMSNTNSKYFGDAFHFAVKEFFPHLFVGISV